MKKFLLSFLTLTLFSTIVFSQTYVDQITGYTNAGGRPAQIFPDFQYCALQTADDFTVPAGDTWTIDSVFSVGTYSGTSNGTFDTVIVTFYNDNTGEPGTIITTDTVILDSSNTDGDLEVVLNNTVILSTGTYWITINVVMGFTANGQWFQGAADTTLPGAEWYLQDPCDLLASGNTGWQSATSFTSPTRELMYRLSSCNSVVDINVTANDNMLTCFQTGGQYKWVDCDNAYTPVPGETNQSFMADVNGNYACIITVGCAIDTTICYPITCINAINNGVAVQTGVLVAMDTSASYQWFDCISNTPVSGATSQAFLPTTTGGYACALTNGCSSDTTSCTNIIVTGIQNLSGDFEINIYPNPAKDILTIEQGSLIVTEITISSSTGSQVLKSKLTSNTIDISNLPKGVYILQLQTSEGMGYTKFIKE